MNATPQCLLKIRQLYPDLSNNYRNIADYLLANPEKVVSNKVRDIAKAANCDDSQIIRFCQKIGYDGFSSMKTSIAVELMPANIVTAEPENGNSFIRVKSSFLENNIKTLRDTVSMISEDEIDKVVKKMSKAGKIFLVGVGASGIVTMDTQIKLMRLGYNVVCHQDTDVTKMMLGLVDPGDVLLAISFSGENKTVCDIAQTASAKKVFIAGVTNFPNSSLAGIADVTLLTASDEKQFRIGATTSRIAQYLVIDFLIISLALKNMKKSEENVLRTSEMIDDSANGLTKKYQAKRK
jgi:DNA-binding MurR/RpiR family transcriptional regulator